jgi:hypothetical protein
VDAKVSVRVKVVVLRGHLGPRQVLNLLVLDVNAFVGGGDGGDDGILGLCLDRVGQVDDAVGGNGGRLGGGGGGLKREKQMSIINVYGSKSTNKV